VGFRVLAIVEDFTADFPMLLADEKSSHMATLFPTIAWLLQIDVSVSFMMSLFNTIRYYIYTFRKVSRHSRWVGGREVQF
jgi:hypothetical protein